jgi:glycosyltransferase involved in cell wall biosynthesis
MKNKILTIGVPTYNRSFLLDKFHELLLVAIKGFESEIEIIVSDNCSTDNTMEICAKWERLFCSKTTYKYTRNLENIGAIRNITSLIDNACGKYFMFIGDDDQLYAEGLCEIIKVISTIDPPSAIIQGPRKIGENNLKGGLYGYKAAGDWFYEYGNAYMGIINTAQAVKVLENKVFRELVEQTVWPQTGIGYIAMAHNPEIPIYITKCILGGHISEWKNVTNKEYWTTSLFGLLKCAELVDSVVGEKWIARRFVRFGSPGFILHVQNIFLHTVISKNISSSEVQLKLCRGFGVTGFIVSRILKITDFMPFMAKITLVIGYSMKNRTSPIISYKHFKLAEARQVNMLNESSNGQYRTSGWF